jgi:hypothetical protein
LTINAAVTRQGFTPISNKFISRPDVDPFSKTILTYLASHSDSFTPSQRQICTATGISLATLKRRLRFLEAAGLLIRIGHGIYNVIRYRVAGCLFDSSQRATSKLSVTHLRTTTQNNNNIIPKGGGVIHDPPPDPPDPPPSTREKAQVLQFPEKDLSGVVEIPPPPKDLPAAPIPPRRKKSRQNRNMSRTETAAFLCRKEKIHELYKPFFVKKNHRRLWSLIEHDWIKHTSMDKLIVLGNRLHDMADAGEIKSPAGFMSRSITRWRGDWNDFLGYLTDRAGI